jgi:indole-3-glycerol phosphate synthase
MDAKPARPAFLDEIIFNKRQEVTALKVHLNIPRVKQLIKSLPAPRNFLKAFKPGRLALIAELKKASPSAGVIVSRFEPISLAKVYEESGAAALSVLTDEKYFQGKLENLAKAKESTTVPVLRKDFIIDESQLYESRVAGADAVLLIAGVLTDEELERFLLLAGTLHLACLVEVHNEAELERVLPTSARLIGINNRDLETFTVDLNTTSRLIDKYPELQKRTVVSESGIASADQVKALKAKGVAGILVGESLLRSRDIGAKIRELME